MASDLDLRIAEELLGRKVCRDPDCDGCDCDVFMDDDGSWLENVAGVAYPFALGDHDEERVQEISFHDMLAEGIGGSELGDLSDGWTPGRGREAETTSELADDLEDECRYRFTRLWDSINARRGFGWDANPWVWVVEFRRVNA